MKAIVNRILALLVIGTFASALALGKTTSKEVTFAQSVSVDGTLIKKGTYNVTFNDETGELVIKRGKKVLATVQARLEKTSDRYSSYTRSDSNDPSKPPTLISILLSAGNQLTIVDKADKTATSVRP